MSIGTFLDPEHSPSPAELKVTLESKWKLWQELTQFIADHYPIAAEWNFGGKKVGWNLWYRKSGKTLINLFPQQAGFMAQVVLGREQVEKAQRIRFGKNVGQVFQNTRQLHDGRWLFIQVRTKKDIQDLQQLMLLKRRPAIT